MLSAQCARLNFRSPPQNNGPFKMAFPCAGEIDDLMVKGTCSCREPRLYSEHPHGGSQPSTTPVTGRSDALFGPYLLILMIKGLHTSQGMYSASGSSENLVASKEMGNVPRPQSLSQVHWDVDDSSPAPHALILFLCGYLLELLSKWCFKSEEKMKKTHLLLWGVLAVFVKAVLVT
ncbi:hypothetical protein STEG23_009908, partial [Scotinomys teguina]